MNDLNQLREKICHLRVLYVEDEIDLHESVHVFLSRFFDTIDDAYNGQEGLNLFEQHQYDVIISDLLMPIMKGSEMIRRMQQHSPELFYVVVTGTSMEETPDIPINLILAKPMDMEAMLQLFETIAQYAERRAC